MTKIFLRGQENEVLAVDEVNLAVNEGDFVAIVGPSGSGKSTLLNLMGLLTYPTRGDVYYRDIPVTKYSDGRRTSVRRDNVGFIFQQYNLLLHLSSWENVALPLICRGVEPSEMRRIAIGFLSKLDMGERADFKVGYLSGGEQQRVAIARALVTEPKIIFADEPTASVDNANANLVIELFKSLKKDGRTLVVSTHDPALRCEANRLLTMNHGRITEEK